MKPLETPRLRIDRWNDEDIDDAAALFGDPDVMRFIPSGVASHEKMKAYIDKMNGGIDRWGHGLCAVRRKSDGRVIGECGLQPIPDQQQVIEIGWLLAKAFWHQGYAREMVTAVTQFAFEDAGLTRIVALIDRENAASIAIANFLHMRFERIETHYKRDLMCYSLTAPSP